MNTCFLLFRFFFFVANFVIWLLGAIFLIITIYLQFEPELQSQLVYPGLIWLFNICTYIFVTVGLILIVVGSLGCAGTYYKNVCIIYTLFTSIVFIFCLEIAAIALFYIKKHELAARLNSNMEKVFKGYNSNNIQFREQLVDLIQDNFACCGWQSPTDYHFTLFESTENTNKRKLTGFPDSCCRSRFRGCGSVAKYYISNLPPAVHQSIDLANETVHIIGGEKTKSLRRCSTPPAIKRNSEVNLSVDRITEALVIKASSIFSKT
ncbi:hypothetical protein GJ496_002386 [Pomphorhynchus laevis]|nr:hypothetical protein GJ496_002386 [Pomphorhynchus laevis]